MTNTLISSSQRLLIAMAILLLSLTGCETLEPVTRRGLAKTLRGHTDGVPSVAFSPDGATLASGSLDTTIRLWDVATGEELATLYGHRTPVNAVPFSPDGKLLASGDGIVWSPTAPLHPSGSGGNEIIQKYGLGNGVSKPFQVILWDVATGTEKTHWAGKTPIHTVAFSPDGKTLVAGGGWPDDNPDAAVLMWEVATGKGKVKGRRDIVWSVAFSPDGTMLVTGEGHGEGITLWGIATGEMRTHLSKKVAVRSVAFSPDGKLIATGDADGVVVLWNWATSQEQTTLGKHKGVVDALAFSPEGTILASAGQHGTVRLWDVTTMEIIAEIRIPRTWIGCVAFSPDGALLATGSSDKLIRLWNLEEVLEQ